MTGEVARHAALAARALRASGRRPPRRRWHGVDVRAWRVDRSSRGAGSDDRPPQPVEHAVAEEAAADVAAGGGCATRGRVRLLHRRRQCRCRSGARDVSMRSAHAAHGDRRDGHAWSAAQMPRHARVSRSSRRVCPACPSCGVGIFPRSTPTACLRDAAVDYLRARPG